MPIKTCEASDCNKKFEPKVKHAKYCSDACRARENKRKKYKERINKGLCPQCGGEMTVAISPHKNKVTSSYCQKCQEYFRNRYKSKRAPS